MPAPKIERLVAGRSIQDAGATKTKVELVLQVCSLIVWAFIFAMVIAYWGA
jgi:hypothetical protein